MDFLNALFASVANVAVQTVSSEFGSMSVMDRDKDLKRFLVANGVGTILDVLSGSTIVRVPESLRETLQLANRICRFILPTEPGTNFGTGFLIGPHHVLTAAHLFFTPKGCVIRPEETNKIIAEFPTLYIGSSMISSGLVRRAELEPIDWSFDPHVANAHADREVADLDYAVISLKDNVGEESVGGEPRGWFQLPALNDLPILTPGVVLRAFQFLDLGALQTATGFVETVTTGMPRVRHTISTLDGSSGSPILSEDLRLAAIHLSGADEDNPQTNGAISIRRVAPRLYGREMKRH